MTNIKTKGIILGSIDYSENSKIVYVFTPFGRLSVMARGAKKLRSKFNGFAQTLNYVEMIITNSSFPSIIDYSIIEEYKEVKKDLKKVLWMSLNLELMNKLPNDIPHERCLNFLLRILRRANEAVNVILLTDIFFLKMLKVFGVEPNFRQCVVCGSNHHLVEFSVEQGGALCITHSKNPHDEKTLKCLEKLYYFDDKIGDFSSLEEIDFHSIFHSIRKYYVDHVNIKLIGFDSLLF